MNTIISVTKLAKKYNLLQGEEQTRSLREALTRSYKSFVGRTRKTKAEGEFWALKDVSFEINEGEVVGIVGRNGAGKSTLLKILSRIVEPTQGRIRMSGRVASLLEVGTGFHPELSGRENIFLNGSILGMSKIEIQRKFDEIVSFADVEKFLETPVKRYSSGMYVRLAFAVAAHLEPDILIVDEVLAVGDAQFQKRCLSKMENVAQEGRTVLFVSHNMGVVQSLCKRAIFLKGGTVFMDDTPQAVVATYLGGLEQVQSVSLSERTDRRGCGKTRLVGIDLESLLGVKKLAVGQPARFDFYLTQVLPNLSCVFTFYDQFGQAIASFNSSNFSQDDTRNTWAEPRVSCELPQLLLNPGRYRMNVLLMADGEAQDYVEGALTFDVEEGRVENRPVPFGQSGNVHMPHRWHLPKS